MLEKILLALARMLEKFLVALAMTFSLYLFAELGGQARPTEEILPYTPGVAIASSLKESYEHQ